MFPTSSRNIYSAQPYFFAGKPALFSLANSLRSNSARLLQPMRALRSEQLLLYETTTKRVLSEVRSTEFTRSGRILQIISERSYSSRGFLWHFFAGTKKCRIKKIKSNPLLFGEGIIINIMYKYNSWAGY